MTIVILFIGVIAVIAGWWLAKQRLMSKPWLEESVVGDVAYETASLPTQTKIGLGVFLAVVSALFVLLISAYSMHMQAPDWRDLPVPDLLWLNTAILVLSSVALQGAQVAARRVERGHGHKSLWYQGDCLNYPHMPI